MMPNDTPRHPHKVELLSPGGSMESIHAAVNAGADAVYAGGTRFGARAYAANPEKDELLEAIDFCHLHGVKLYMTVNTLLKQRELEEELFTFLAPYYEAGVDAVLVQDLGVLQMIRTLFPGLPLHASTQMSVQSPAGAGLSAELGISRIVPARELSLTEIREIYDETGMEIECFIHGALCYSYSGQCLLSSLIGGRSGNRGRCAQPCRKRYLLTDAAGNLLSVPGIGSSVGRNRSDPGIGSWAGRNPSNAGAGTTDERMRYLLNLKDIMGLDLIPELVEAGVASFKIEGRMKSELYTAGVTAIYRKYIDLYEEKGAASYRVEEADRQLLSDLFRKRGYSGGYYHVQNSPSMMAPDVKPKAKPEPDPEGFVLLREQYLSAEKKEKIKGIFTLQKDREAILEVACAGQHVRVIGPKAQEAKSRAVTKEEVTRQLQKTGDTPFAFEDLSIEMEDGLFIPMGALNVLRREALTRLQDVILAPYRRERASDFGEGANENGNDLVAGNGIDENGNDLVAGNGIDENGNISVASNGGLLETPRKDVADQETNAPGMTAFVSSPAQLEAVLDPEGGAAIGTVYLDSMTFLDETFEAGQTRDAIRDHARKDPDAIRARIRKTISSIQESGKEAAIALPPIWRTYVQRRFFRVFTEEILQEADALLLRCFDQLGTFGRGQGPRVPRLVSDASIYAWNRRAVKELQKLGISRVTMPVELSGHELAAVFAEKTTSPMAFELSVYGWQTAMITAQCLRKNTVGCDGTPSLMFLQDETKARFPVRNRCGVCMNEICNSVPLDLTGLDGEIQRSGAMLRRLTFTIESAGQTTEVLQRAARKETAQREASQRKASQKDAPQRESSAPFTRGLFRRGAE